ncbi:NERD domain-containing protein [Pseudaminobacter soli (ex Li et al. 2025)]|uniref:NERD domain-containing protein n=1 Tax=Pseudaminobacter soli (ex Li et al. 2025) TaxID=1295366 RepID=UPI001FE1828C|nr:NERD domain-containing protein [Mesorhizobium soli]
MARIRERRPNARIIHEINVSTYGPNRIDVLAVDRAEIISVEIKSAKDKLDRLPAQIESMNRVAHHVVAALHEKFLVEQETNQWAAHYERDGKFYLRRVPDGIKDAEVWVYPEIRRAMPIAEHDGLARWRFPDQRVETSLPSAALDMLWRDELYELCGMFRISATRRSNMSEMMAALRWNCTGKDLTRGVCWMLRARRCVEADPEIVERIAA